MVAGEDQRADWVRASVCRHQFPAVWVAEFRVSGNIPHAGSGYYASRQHMRDRSSDYGKFGFTPLLSCSRLRVVLNQLNSLRHWHLFFLAAARQEVRKAVGVVLNVFRNRFERCWDETNPRSFAIC